MKLLFDQNISFRIVKKITPYFPKSKQVKGLGLVNKTDEAIWKFAKLNNFTIVTFDADFNNIASLRGCPPKIIWLRVGNTNTDSLVEILKKRKPIIAQFLTHLDYKNTACLEIT